MDDFSSCDILKLAELLKPQKADDSGSDDESENQNEVDKEFPKATPKVNERPTPKQNIYAKLENSSQEPKKSIENPEDEGALYFDDECKVAENWKVTPQWDVSYKQQVTVSDVFLQMGNKGPSTSSCEEMLIKIHLPSENHRNIDLKVTADRIKLVSPKFKLDEPLPQPVNPKCGNAKWDADSEQLIVSLKMDREFDFLHFD